MPKYSKEIKIFYYSKANSAKSGTSIKASSSPNLEKNAKSDCLDQVGESAIFLFQISCIEGKMFNNFYDSGCSELVGKKAAIESLRKMGRAKQERPGPITLAGVGDQQTVCRDGIHSVCLPLHDGTEAIMSGLCLDKVTAAFPKYPLHKVEKNVQDVCLKLGGQELINKLPKCPKEVDDETDFMIGIK